MDDESKGAAEPGAPTVGGGTGARPAGEGDDVEPHLVASDQGATAGQAALPSTEDVAASSGEEPRPPAADEAEPAPDADATALAWDDDLPQAMGEEEAGDETWYDRFEDADDLGELSDDPLAGRRNALPPRVESWRTRSATGAIATALAMGLQQVFQPEKRRPAIIAEAPSDPYDDDDPITVDYLPDDATGTRVHVKPWLLGKGDPS